METHAHLGMNRTLLHSFAGAALAIAFLAMLCAGCHGGRSTGAPGNVVPNGDLTSGTGDLPDNWRSDSIPPGTATFRWNHAQGGPGELEIDNIKPADTRWTQKIHLAPGWYHFTASVRAEGIPPGNMGATLGVMPEGFGVPVTGVTGTTDWKPVGFYLKVGGSGADIALVCRLGGLSSENTGKAFCRDIKGMSMNEEPPAGATPRWEL
jgi:hypothetical protein